MNNSYLHRRQKHNLNHRWQVGSSFLTCFS